jgi:phosphoribosylformimino-5-aminoimidazole carboxamide ribotide isomerase
MEVIPAIDLHGGRVVRLHQGRFDDVTAFSDAPLEVAQQFAARGARWLHLVDLDAARDGSRPAAHAAVLAELAASPGPALQAGGGFRDRDAVDDALEAGVDRVIIGTLAIREPETVASLAAHHGARICVSADVAGSSARIAGWLEDSGKSAVELVEGMAAAGISVFLVTAVERDGTLAGPDLRLVDAVRAVTGGTLIVAGGIASVGDIMAVRDAGADAVVVGRAVLDGRLDLEAALAAGRTA